METREERAKMKGRHIVDERVAGDKEIDFTYDEEEPLSEWVKR